MDFRKVRSGDDLVIPAATWNAMVDAAQAFRESARNKTNIAAVTGNTPTTVTVKNANGSGLVRFDVVVLDEPVIDPADNEDEFINRLAIGVKQATDSSAKLGTWGVMQEPLASDAFGKCCVSGLTICWIDLADTEDTRCGVVSGSLTPVSGSSGSAKIVWVAGGVGDADATGEQWALILLGADASKSIPVKFTGTESGGGFYAGKIAGGTSTASGSSDLSLPEGLSVGDDCLILHAPEDGKPTHWVKLNTFTFGLLIGMTDDDEPKPIVLVSNAEYRRDSPVNVDDGSGTTEGVKTWDRDVVTDGDDQGDDPVEETYVTRFVWDGGAGELLMFQKTRVFDAGGNLVSISAETRTVIDTAADCTE